MDHRHRYIAGTQTRQARELSNPRYGTALIQDSLPKLGKGFRDRELVAVENVHNTHPSRLFHLTKAAVSLELHLKLYIKCGRRVRQATAFTHFTYPFGSGLTGNEIAGSVVTCVEILGGVISG